MKLQFINNVFRPRYRAIICGATACVVFSGVDISRVVHACGSALESSRHYDLVAPQNADQGTPPGSIEQDSIEIDYVPRPTSDSTGCGLSKKVAACASTAGLQIRFRPPHDEDTPKDRLGYRIEVIGDLSVFTDEDTNGSSYFAPEGIINLEFIGSAAQATKLAIILRALDPEGNEGDPSDPVSVAIQAP